MTGRVLVFTQPEALPREFVPSPSRRSVRCYGCTDTKAECELESEFQARGLGCVRGSIFAVLFEAGAALLIYGLWQAWHLLR